MQHKYSDEFKKAVIEDYYTSPLGVRAIALKYDLPSKNYLDRWEKYLKAKGIIPMDATKPSKTAGRSPEAVMRKDTKTEREKRYEAEIEVLKAKVEYLESLDSLQPFLKKKVKLRELKYKVMMMLELKYPIWLLAEIAGISKSAYYKHKRRPLSNANELDHIIIDIYNKSNKRAGYRTIKYILKNNYNQIVNHKKVLRIMSKHGIHSIVREKHKKPKEQIILKENILNRNFKADKPGEKYVTDITYIPTQKKMMYLSMIIDVYDNLPVAWNISDTQDKSLSIDTIKKLSEKYALKDSIIHSDQGIHYTNKDYVNLLNEFGVKQSMSRKGNCWDNAVAESFFSHYKCESIYLMDKKIKEPRDVIEITEEYIDYYSNQRPQKKLGGLPPSLYRQNQVII